MCLAVPGKIIEVKPAAADSAPGPLGIVDFNGTRVEASLAMTPQAGEGDWVLVHAGFALTVLDEAEAQLTFETLKLALDEP